MIISPYYLHSQKCISLYVAKISTYSLNLLCKNGLKSEAKRPRMFFMPQRCSIPGNDCDLFRSSKMQ